MSGQPVEQAPRCKPWAGTKQDQPRGVGVAEKLEDLAQDVGELRERNAVLAFIRARAASTPDRGAALVLVTVAVEIATGEHRI